MHSIMRMEGPNSAPVIPPRSERRSSTSEREKLLQLGILWEKQRFTTEGLRERGIFINPEDLKEYARRKKEFDSKRAEEPTWAEWICAEGMDSEGEVGRGYAWLGEGVQAFLPHKIDDVLRGTDVIVMLTDLDAEDKRAGYPLALDITTESSALFKKFNRKMTDMHPDRPSLPRVVWMDSHAEEAGSFYDAPQEGNISSLQVTLYIPPDCVDRFMDSTTSLSDIDKLMNDMRPFVLYQLQAQLELQARHLLGELRWMEGRILPGRTVPSHVRQDLQQKMSLLSGDRTPRERAFSILHQALKTVWAAQEESGDLLEVWQKRLPVCIKDMKVLPAKEQTKTAA